MDILINKIVIWRIR